MSTDTHLRSIASEPNWITFAKALRAAMRSAPDYGFESADQLLNNVAHLRGVDVASLRNPLVAEHWLEQFAPEQTASENVNISMSGVLLLAQISRISKDLSDSLAPKVFSGEINRSQLQAALELAKTERGGSGGLAHDRVRRVKEFENLVFTYLNKNFEALGLKANAKIKKCPRDAPLSCDIVAYENGRPAIAIEVKSYRQKRHKRFLVEVLGTMSLLSRNYPRAMLIVPESWAASIETLRVMKHDLNLDEVQLAAIDDQVKAKDARLRFLE